MTAPRDFSARGGGAKDRVRRLNWASYGASSWASYGALTSLVSGRVATNRRRLAGSLSGRDAIRLSASATTISATNTSSFRAKDVSFLPNSFVQKGTFKSGDDRACHHSGRSPPSTSRPSRGLGDLRRGSLGSVMVGLLVLVAVGGGRSLMSTIHSSDDHDYLSSDEPHVRVAKAAMQIRPNDSGRWARLSGVTSFLSRFIPRVSSQLGSSPDVLGVGSGPQMRYFDPRSPGHTGSSMSSHQASALELYSSKKRNDYRAAYRNTNTDLNLGLSANANSNSDSDAKLDACNSRSTFSKSRTGHGFRRGFGHDGKPEISMDSRRVMRFRVPSSHVAASR
uniref:Uncharacterized protein n=1 Tax=Amorphochlora amoebiformis TaxID=1561963 RepID=A0A7S0CUE2_9EUKA|mmetsp:Transcript_12859/g.20331  ORF Transcript_12859/g.20331 Transcript_12859/m.20331 type:complete len:337 (+) Transcript_12859:130-1140(+)